MRTHKAENEFNKKMKNASYNEFQGYGSFALLKTSAHKTTATRGAQADITANATVRCDNESGEAGGEESSCLT